MYVDDALVEKFREEFCQTQVRQFTEWAQVVEAQHYERVLEWLLHQKTQAEKDRTRV